MDSRVRSCRGFRNRDLSIASRLLDSSYSALTLLINIVLLKLVDQSDVLWGNTLAAIDDYALGDKLVRSPKQRL